MIKPLDKTPKRPAGSVNDAAVEISRKQEEQDLIEMEAGIRETADMAHGAAQAAAEPDSPRKV